MTGIPTRAFSVFGNCGMVSIVDLAVVCITAFAMKRRTMSECCTTESKGTTERKSILTTVMGFVCTFIPALVKVVMLTLVGVNGFGTTSFRSINTHCTLPILTVRTVPTVVYKLLFTNVMSTAVSDTSSSLLNTKSVFTGSVCGVIVGPDTSSGRVVVMAHIAVTTMNIFTALVTLFGASDVIAVLVFTFALHTTNSFFPCILKRC